MIYAKVGWMILRENAESLVIISISSNRSTN